MNPGVWWRKLRFRLQRARFEREMAEEMALHRELRTHRRFGNTTRPAEQSREVWEWAWLENLLRDFRLAARSLRRRPVFTAAAVLSLTLALGANTAVFSFVRGIVLKRLPVPGAERLVHIEQRNEMFHMDNCCFKFAFYEELRRRDTGLEDILGVSNPEAWLSDGETRERAGVELVSGNYFTMLGVRPAAGRLLSASDDRVENAAPVAVISHRLWRNRFAERPDTVGRTLRVNSDVYVIVGVAEPGFQGSSLHDPRDIFIPSAMVSRFLGVKREEAGWIMLLGRLRQGVSIETARARLNEVGRQVQKVTGPQMGPRDDFLVREAAQGLGKRKAQWGRAVLLLMLLVAVVLLVACANLSALLSVRGVERARDAGLRAALGASRAALVRQYLAEAFLLAAGGGALAWMLARVSIGPLLSLLGREGAALAPHVQPDPAVLAFLAVLTLASAALFGLYPAWRAARTLPLPSRAPRRPVFAALLAIQFALSLGLLYGAGLFAQTLRNLRGIDLGLDSGRVALVHLDLSGTVYEGARSADFLRRLAQEAQALPGARAASLSNLSVLSGSMQSIVLRLPGASTRPVTYFMGVSPGYFATLGIPLLGGRDFTPADRASSERPVIVNQQFARQYLNGDALGKVFAFGGNMPARVVGVAGTAKFRYLKEEPQPVMYLPLGETDDAWLHVRSTVPRAALDAQLRSLVASLDRRVAITRLTSLEAQIDDALARERLLAALASLLSGLAVLLAAIGLYGVLAFATASRTREIGIRMALGSARGSIARLVLTGSLRVVACGVALGLPLAWGCGRLAESVLYGLKAEDAASAAGALAVLLASALAASLIPAWRAARTDPASALRHE